MADNKNSAARIQANNRYNAKAYDRINIAIPRGRKVTVEEAATAACEGGLISQGTVNSLMNLLIREHLGMSEDEWKSPCKGDAGEDIGAEEYVNLDYTPYIQNVVRQKP